MGNKFIIAVIVLIIAVFGVSSYFIMSPSQLDDIADNSSGGLMNNLFDNSSGDLANLNSTSDKNLNNNSTNSNVDNSSNKKNDSNSSKISVSATQSGPSSASIGSSILITWNVKNNGNVPITNVKGLDQNNAFDFGTLGPGESKSTTYSLYIPRAEEITDDFINNSQVSSPFYVGGFSISYDANGQSYSFNSNSLEIAMD